MNTPGRDELTYSQVQARIKELEQRAATLRADIEELAASRVLPTRTRLQDAARYAYGCGVELEALHDDREEE